jgi:hypothetical protein
MNFSDGRCIFEFGIAITAQSLGKADNEYGIDFLQGVPAGFRRNYKQGNLVAPRIERTSIQFEGDCR